MIEIERCKIQKLHICQNNRGRGGVKREQERQIRWRQRAGRGGVNTGATCIIKNKKKVYKSYIQNNKKRKKPSTETYYI
jgi:hypothetical protein